MSDNESIRSQSNSDVENSRERGKDERRGPPRLQDNGDSGLLQLREKNRSVLQEPTQRNLQVDTSSLDNNGN